ncbi:ATP-binding protein [Wenjunlia tyrosinilytica]|jgi:anti-sigma regulatory factor (Ser/Thr protein kinase)|uniref:Histidine kinase/HSP90-like ATPase domain-containing protein n=1 Tax=Wenjunlia tyrosinilytica TaxID=1544741 RepID=A0A918DWF6_9ACTN|nr:ATP-binding protein [Wenjunlia tyrosinilytica]GGO85575.1 hypothetical protein GCM10012280_19670 [Wenjunlia tyrosinilytica]
MRAARSRPAYAVRPAHAEEGVLDDDLSQALWETYRMPLDTGCSSAAARIFTRRCLNRWEIGDDSLFGEDVVLVVSELVTNAMIHADSPEELRLSWRSPSLVVEVRDTGPGQPYVRPSDDSEPGSRGMEIVDRLARHWLIAAGAGDTKTIRVEMVSP